MGLKKDIEKAHKINDVTRVQYFDSRYYKIDYVDNKKQKMQKHLPSVTEILGAYPKDFLARWRGDVGNDRADQIIRQALNLGSFIHYGAEILAKGGTVIYNPVQNPIYSDEQIRQMQKKCEVCVCRFQLEFLQLYRIWQFFQFVRPTQIQTEQTVFSIKHEYAGTLDLLMYIKKGYYSIAGSEDLYLEEGFYVGDYKTGKGVDTSNKMQISAYMHAILEAMPKMKIVGGLLLHPNNEHVTKGIEGFKATLVTLDESYDYLKNFLKVYDVYKINKPVPAPKEFTMPSILTLVEEKTKGKRK